MNPNEVLNNEYAGEAWERTFEAGDLRCQRIINFGEIYHYWAKMPLVNGVRIVIGTGTIECVVPSGGQFVASFDL